jgi:hypothetical protein
LLNCKKNHSYFLPFEVTHANLFIFLSQKRLQEKNITRKSGQYLGKFSVN